MSSRPPLDLQVELVFPDGSTTRWDSDSPIENEPTGISSRTQRYVGFADATVNLARPIDRDYPDLGLLSGINLIGYDGSVAYEGWLAGAPRSLQTSPQVALQLSGWMAHGKDEPFVEAFVDRDQSKWSGPSAYRTAALLNSKWALGSMNELSDTSGEPTVELTLPDTWEAPYRPAVEAWWLPQAGISIGQLYYKLAAWAPLMNGDANWRVRAVLSSDDKYTATDTADLWPAASAVSGYLAATADRECAALQQLYELTPGGTPSAPSYSRFQQLAVYGTHGLEPKGEAPGGFTVSEIMRNIAGRFAPLLDTSGVQDTSYIVRHSSFLEETLPYDAWLLLNAYHRWELAVYEQRKLLYYPLDRNDWDWEVRRSDPGVTVTLQGDDSEHLCNGVIVRYRDIDTGYQTRLSPDDFPELRDRSPNNPVNEAGRRKFTPLSISPPITQKYAIQMGRAYLAEFNQAQAPGEINIADGYVRDRAGHWQPGWKVRSGDRLIINDLPNDSVRVVGETDWQHDGKAIRIAVDSSFKELDAVIARLETDVQASGLNLP